jgi:hypothetical protein
VQGANGAKGPTLPLSQRARVCGYMGTQVSARARACARQCHDHGGGRDGDSDMAAQTANA